MTPWLLKVPPSTLKWLALMEPVFVKLVWTRISRSPLIDNVLSLSTDNVPMAVPFSWSPSRVREEFVSSKAASFAASRVKASSLLTALIVVEDNGLATTFPLMLEDSSREIVKAPDATWIASAPLVLSIKPELWNVKLLFSPPRNTPWLPSPSA